IDRELKRIGSGLSVDEVLRRADIEHCHGCHAEVGSLGEGVVFPTGLAAAHIIEVLETTNGVTRFTISPALRDVFAPNRAKILSDFLAGKPLPVHAKGGTIGGGRTTD